MRHQPQAASPACVRACVPRSECSLWWEWRSPGWLRRDLLPSDAQGRCCPASSLARSYLVCTHRGHSTLPASLRLWTPECSGIPAGRLCADSPRGHTRSGWARDNTPRGEHSPRSVRNLRGSVERTGLHSGPWSNLASLLNGRERI